MWWWDMTEDERTEAMTETGVTEVTESEELRGTVNRDDLDEVLVMRGNVDAVEDLAHRLAVSDYTTRELEDGTWLVATYHA